MFQLGREAKIKSEGKTYTLPRLEYRLVLAFRDWIAEQEGDPFADVKELHALGLLDPAHQKEMIEEAKLVKKQLQAFSLACPLAQKYMTTEVGMAELLYIAMSEKHPDITREVIFGIIVEQGAEEMAKKIKQAQGEPPAEKNESAPAA